MRPRISFGLSAMVLAFGVNAADDAKNVDANKLFLTLRTIQKIDLSFRAAESCRMRSNITAELARQRDAGKTLAEVLNKLQGSNDSQADAGRVFASSESPNKLSDQIYKECELTARKKVLEDVQM
jgi:hypothetical protein